MAIASSDLKIKYSVKTGSAGNSTASSAAASLGKYISTTEMLTTLNGLFDDVSAVENEASTVEYRCVFIHNSHASLTLQGTLVYLYSEVSGGAAIAIGVDTTAASAIGASSAQAVEVANETTAPSGISFSSPTTVGTALSIGDLPAGQCRAVWVRRTAANSAAVDNDGCVLRWYGGTAA